MSETGLANIRPTSVPFCLKCQRNVEELEVETLVETIHGWQGSTSHHTGEVIVTVRCHGEQWKASNWRGILKKRRYCTSHTVGDIWYEAVL